MEITFKVGDDGEIVLHIIIARSYRLPKSWHMAHGLLKCADCVISCHMVHGLLKCADRVISYGPSACSRTSGWYTTWLICMVVCLSLLNHNFMKFCCQMRIVSVFYNPLCILFVFAFVDGYSLVGVIGHNFTSSMFSLFFKPLWKLPEDTFS